MCKQFRPKKRSGLSTTLIPTKKVAKVSLESTLEGKDPEALQHVLEAESEHADNETAIITEIRTLAIELRYSDVDKSLRWYNGCEQLLLDELKTLKAKQAVDSNLPAPSLNVLSDQEGTDGSGSDRNTKRSKGKTSRKSKLDEISAKIDPNIIKQRQEVRTCHCVYVK